VKHTGCAKASPPTSGMLAGTAGSGWKAHGGRIELVPWGYAAEEGVGMGKEVPGSSYTKKAGVLACSEGTREHSVQLLLW